MPVLSIIHTEMMKGTISYSPPTNDSTIQEMGITQILPVRSLNESCQTRYV